jgi:hypothetical protein
MSDEISKLDKTCKTKMPNQSLRKSGQNVEMLLSSRGLQNIISNEKDFTFKVNGQCFRMSKFQAEFISPSVSNLVRFDSTMDGIEILRRAADECFHYFSSPAEGQSGTIASGAQTSMTEQGAHAHGVVKTRELSEY